MNHSIVGIVKAECLTKADRIEQAQELAEVIDAFHSRLVALGWNDVAAAKMTRIMLAGVLGLSSKGEWDEDEE